MRVLHLWDSYSPGLFDRSFEICAEAGIDAELACMHFVDRGEALPLGVRLVRRIDGHNIAGDLQARAWKRFTRLFDMERFRWLARESVRRFDPNVIHLHYGTTAAIFKNVKEVIDRPLIISFYGFDISQGFQQPATREAYRTLMQHNPLVHVLCDEARSRALMFGASAECIVDANLPLPVERYPYIGITNHQIRRWLIPARFVEKKGHAVLLEAFRILIDQQPHHKLTCWGYGSCEWLKALIDRFSLAESVDVIDNRSEATFDRAYVERLREHDVVVAPSVRSTRGDDEGGPALTAVLAQVAGKPLIVSNFPGSERSVTDGVEGFVVPENDAPSLAGAMKRLAVDPARARQMGQAGRDRAIREFSRASYRHALLSWYARQAVSRPDDPVSKSTEN